MAWCCGISIFWVELFVCSEILKSVFLNRFVMKVVSLPKYVKEVVLVCPSEVVVGGLWGGGLCVCVCGLENRCLT